MVFCREFFKSPELTLRPPFLVSQSYDAQAYIKNCAGSRSTYQIRPDAVHSVNDYTAQDRWLNLRVVLAQDRYISLPCCQCCGRPRHRREQNYRLSQRGCASDDSRQLPASAFKMLEYYSPHVVLPSSKRRVSRELRRPVTHQSSSSFL